jgi:succinyl-diaminopimelate desuccinylase
VYAFAIGGGTYAKAMKNGVAFGPNFPGQENLVHKTNEFISIEHLLKLTDIYREAIGKLLEQQ